MIEKVQMTFLLLLGVSWLSLLFDASFEAGKVNDAIKFMVLGVLFGSATAAVVLTLIRIWS